MDKKWTVTFQGGFWGKRGSTGKEINVNKSFRWKNAIWRIPSVYVCKEGIVIDYIMETDPEDVKAFLERWSLENLGMSDYSREQQERIAQEHPMNGNFSGILFLNGEEVCGDIHGSAVGWFPESIRTEDTPQDQAQEALEHYGLDPERAWTVNRSAYEIPGMKEENLRSLQVKLIADRGTFYGDHFKTEGEAGERILVHPLTGKQYTLHIQKIENRCMDQGAFRNPRMEYPACYQELEYSVEPDIPADQFVLRDAAAGDLARPAKTKEEKGAVTDGGPDGPTAVFVMHGGKGGRTACSAMRFEPVTEVEWCPVFQEKVTEDLQVEIYTYSEL